MTDQEKESNKVNVSQYTAVTLVWIENEKSEKVFCKESKSPLPRSLEDKKNHLAKLMDTIKHHYLSDPVIWNQLQEEELDIEYNTKFDVAYTEESFREKYGRDPIPKHSFTTPKVYDALNTVYLWSIYVDPPTRIYASSESNKTNKRKSRFVGSVQLLALAVGVVLGLLGGESFGDWKLSGDGGDLLSMIFFLTGQTIALVCFGILAYREGFTDGGSD